MRKYILPISLGIIVALMPGNEITLKNAIEGIFIGACVGIILFVVRRDSAIALLRWYIEHTNELIAFYSTDIVVRALDFAIKHGS